MLMILFSTLNVIRHLICGQQLELASEPKSDLRDTVDWISKSGFPIVGGKWARLPTILRPSSLKNEALHLKNNPPTH